jgi:hypothetical protein
MILQSSDKINPKDISIDKCRTYSNNFFFYPIKYLKKQILIQTPKLFSPYGENYYNDKCQIDLYLTNKKHDENINLFVENIKNIEDFIKKKFNNLNVVNIIKNDTIKLKIYDCLYFDEHKRKIDSIPSNVYGNFIINLYGVWIYNEIVYFQCNLLQAKICMPFFLKEYSFIDDLQVKKNIPPPPPLPPTNLKKKYQRQRQNPIIKNKLKVSFNPPSIKDIQNALETMKKNKKN